jgi:nucleotide-binding universal stress UspA family protein
VGRALLGSVSQQVLSHAICSVRVARFREDASRIAGDPVRIVLGIDGSVDSAAAAEGVAKRAWPKGTEVRVVFAADPHVAMAFLYAPPFGIWGPGAEPDPEGRSAVTSLVETVAKRLREAGLIASPAVREGDPKQVLVREAETFNADCVFVGAKGHSRLDRFLLGSVSSAVANRAPCSVEVVREP